MDVPPAVKEATCRALEEGLTHYAQRAGIAALQETKSNVAEMKRIYNQRRKFMIKRLK